MTTIAYSSSLVSQLPFADTQHLAEGYYRSKLFTGIAGGNPLISAASPVFSLLERLGLSTTLPPVEHIRQNIEHELRAFQSKLIRKNYAEELSLIAYYLLCATIDEIIGKNYLRVHGTPIEFVAFTPLSSDNQGPQHLFFSIVNHLKEKTNQYLDIIELAYYCLVTGFEGEKRSMTDGRQILENLIEELHQLINQHRVHPPSQPLKERVSYTPSQTYNKPFIIICSIILCSMLAIAYLSHSLLEYKANQILMKHKTTIHTDTE
jgi:type VI secretion system protein ImpK